MSKTGQFKKLAAVAHKATSVKVDVSFKFLDLKTDGFFVHGIDQKYYEKLFEAFNRISEHTVDEIKTRTASGLTPKPINWDYEHITQKGFPASVPKNISDCAFEIRVTKELGRVHGFIFNNTFYVVWIDPAHNLFPGVEQNRLRKVRSAADYITIKCFSAEEFNALTHKIESLTAENKQYEELLTAKTAPY